MHNRINWFWSHTLGMPQIEGSSIPDDRRGCEKKGRNPPWSENINNWVATAVTPNTNGNNQWTDTVPLSDSIHTPPSWASQTRRHMHTHTENGSGGNTQKISTHHSGTLSLSISRRILRARERKKWEDGVEEMVGEREPGGARVAADEPTWAVPSESSLPPPLSLPAASPSQPLKTLPMLLSSRFPTLPSGRSAVLPAACWEAACSGGWVWAWSGCSASVCGLRWAGP